MRVTIVFPSYPTRPIGGFKVLYEYANRLTARGHAITLIHPRSTLMTPTRPDRVKSLLWAPKVRALSRNRLPTWFPLDRSVDVRLVRTLSKYAPPDADVLMATGWQTARWVADQPATKGRKFYFVQDYEYWASGDAVLRREMCDTFHLGLRHIVVSDAVRSMLDDCNATAEAQLQPAIDDGVFYLTAPIEHREDASVCFPLRPEPFKGTADAIAALRRVSEELGSPLRAIGFGEPGVGNYPRWIEVPRRPSDAGLRELLNSVSIFVLPSHYEGFGLPGLEAMACGAALVASDSRGVREYAHDGENAILVPPKRPDLLAEAIRSLIFDRQLRLRLARGGLEQARAATWGRAVSRMERVLTSGSPAARALGAASI